MPAGRLDAQLAFLGEIDKLKEVCRRNLVGSGRRRENSAEHSWHLGVMAVLLAEHFPEPLDLSRAMAMALIHDIVEIDAGDTFAYGPETAGKNQRESLLLHRMTGGRVWQEHGVRRSQVLARVDEIRLFAPGLWPTVCEILDEAVRGGQLAED